MKFSKKGREKIGEFLCGFQYRRTVAPLNFEPSDFEDCVVLTTKEAKALIDLLSHAEDQRTEPYSYDACDEWALKLTNALKEMK